MKQKLKISVIVFVSLFAYLLLSNFVVHAQSKKLTNEESAYLVASCTPIINKLNQLHVSDALMRVNRGQLYETILTKLMNSFDKRLQNNSLDASSLTTVTATFSSQLDTFRKDYIAYEEQLSSTIKISCTSDPQAFVDSLDTSRQYRMKVYEDVQKLNSSIDDYYRAFSNIKTSILGQGVN